MKLNLTYLVAGLLLLQFSGPLIFVARAQPAEIRFQTLSITQGLSHNTVTSIIKDRKGFMWIGTNDGLNLFDGYGFTVFKTIINDSTSVSGNRINKVYEDRQGNIWAGTRNGLNRFDRECYNFKRYSLGQEGSETGDFIKAIFEDSRGKLWIGTYGNGLFQLDRESGEFKKMPINTVAGPEEKVMEQFISSIYEDREGRIWIGTNRTGVIQYDYRNGQFRFIDFREKFSKLPQNSLVKTVFQDKDGEIWVCSEWSGLFRYTPASGKLIHYEYLPGKNGLQNNIIKDIFQDRDGLIWLATDGSGINFFNKETSGFSHLQYDVGDPHSLASNAIYCFYNDDQGITWIGTFGGGISIYNPNLKPFYHITQLENREKSLSFKSVLCFAEDREGIIWIGTDGGGLNRFDPASRKFRHFLHDPADPGSISSNAVTSVFIDSRNRYWVGAYAGGLNLFNPETGKFRRYLNQEDDSASLIQNNVWTIYETQDGTLLVGTLGGLEVFDPVKETFTHYFMEKQFGNSYFNRVLSLLEDSKGRLWVGGTGLWLMNMEQKSFSKVKLTSGNDTLEWDFDIRDIMEDRDGILWLATEGAGLMRFVPETGSFTIFNETGEDGLPNNAIHQILEDFSGKLWISSNSGLSRFDPLTQTFRNYDVNDGLQSNQFSYSASLRAADGTMYFGGVNGFNYFDPGAIRDNEFIPPVSLTGFRLFNKQVSLNAEGSPLSKHISESESMVLRHHQSVITFEFTALNYTSSQKNRYEYIMEGFEQEWNKVVNQRSATYTNLDPGDYIFRVRASNNDGKWNETGTSIAIKVLPPFWKTKLAFVVYTFILLLLLFSFRQYAISRAQMKNQIALQELEKNKIEEVNLMKMQFFTNISHEFRTPLTLILSPLERLMQRKDLDEMSSQLYVLMHRNASRLLKLINQLMDMRKIERGSMDLRLNKADIIQFTGEIKNAFNDLASEKKIEYDFKPTVGFLECWFDPDKVEKILFNLISNAFKFTSSGGKISVRIASRSIGEIEPSRINWLRRKQVNMPESLLPGYIEIVVKDSGAGIPEELHEKIFDRFYQVNTGGKGERNSGTGIGLSLAREFAILHKGILTLSSEPGKGSRFKLLLPSDPSCYTSSQMLAEKPQGIDFSELASIQDQKINAMDESLSRTQTEGGQGIPSLLIVEDNSDVSSFIRISLEPVYQIEEASNGKEGYEKARELVPDLIISDIMMPEMDGIEMAGLIHRDEITSHIPLIFLTAKTGEENRIQGLSTGVEDYISKPFNPKELALKVRNIIEKRRKHAEKVKKQLLLEPSEVHVESFDERFMKKAMEIVEKYLAEPEFDVQQFVSEMGMSRSVLYRKLRAVTNQSANEFINTIRLKRAAQLLRLHTMNVSEISFAVGFNDPQYFSKCFRKQYGMTPSRFASESEN